MKSIFLSVVVICALAIAGIGGTFANMSDTEMVKDSAFTTGDMDLMVCDAEGFMVNDPPYGPGASSVIDIDCAVPGKTYHGTMCLCNEGCIDGTLYIHFKNFRGINVEPSHDDVAMCQPWQNKTEPELVEERGGTLDQIWVTGKGKYGDGSTYPLSNYVYVQVKYRGDYLFGDWTLLKDVECDWLELGILPKCGAENQQTVHVYLMYDNILDPNWTGDDLFEYHFSNGLMADKLLFDVDFGLVSEDPS